MVSSSFEPDDEDYKNIMRNARGKLEIPMPAAMPRKIPINSGEETFCGIGKSKTKYACIVEADESMRIRMEGSQNKTMKTTSQEESL